MSESQIELAICQAVTKKGHFVIKLKDQAKQVGGSYRKGSSFQIRGVSDLVVFLPGGKAIWMEVKTETGRQSKFQQAFEHRIDELGHIYVLVRSVGDAIAIIDQHLQAA